MPRHTYAYCWNVSPVERAALRGLYVPPSGGVAIRTTFRRLTQSFIDESDDDQPGMSRSIYIGMVHYADHSVDRMPEGNSMWPFLFKRHSFEFEHELRAVIQDVPTVGAPPSRAGFGPISRNPHPLVGRYASTLRS